MFSLLLTFLIAIKSQGVSIDVIDTIKKEIPAEHSVFGNRLISRRVHNDLFIHSKAQPFPYEKEITNEYQLLNHPSTIQEQYDDGYTISSVLPLEIDNDEIVTVTFQSTKPDSGDWIAAYSPASADITTTVPVKYAWCNTNISYLSTGVGSLAFNFTNLRADIAFYFFVNGSYANSTPGYENPYVVPTVGKLVLLMRAYYRLCLVLSYRNNSF